MSLNVVEETVRVLQSTEAQYRKQLSVCTDEKEKQELKRKLRIVEDELQVHLGNLLN